MAHHPETTPQTRPHAWRVVLAAMLATSFLTAAGMSRLASAALTGFSPELTRAPYLTDLTPTSVRITWATTTQHRGTVTWGPEGACGATTVTATGAGTRIAVGTRIEYQNSVEITGLSPSTRYCYRVSTAAGTDLLGTVPSPVFTTMAPAADPGPVTFAVLGDWGETSPTGGAHTSQAAVLDQIARSGARFAVSTGDTGTPNGTQINYGDLQQSGVNTSAVFGPDHWARPGTSMPMFSSLGNHGRNPTFLSVWPQPATRAASGGVYDMVSYPSVLGSNPAAYPTSYFAFSTGGVRFYVLDSTWSDLNVGSATGGTCGDRCRNYEVDREAHWRPGQAEYEWLRNDLAAHPGGVKLAFFHFPLRADDHGSPSNIFAQNRAGNPDSLEKLLHDHGVGLAFNGHSHTYQRHAAPPGGVPSYVTGGGGARLTSVSNCSRTDAYGIGWSFSAGTGSACGAASPAASAAEVFHFLKVTVDGSRVTVTPTNAAGRTFDVRTWDLGPDTTAPSAPGALTVRSVGAAGVDLSWAAATDDTGIVAYDVYRDGQLLGTTADTVLGYTDEGAGSAGHTYRVEARDLRGNVAEASAGPDGAEADQSAPTAPGGLTAQPVGSTSVALSWQPAQDDVGVTNYLVQRDGRTVATLGVGSTEFTDTGLSPGTSHTYTVSAKDAAGNSSAPSAPATVATGGDETAPSAPGGLWATSVAAGEVRLAWDPSTDDSGVVRYEAERDGTVVGTSVTTSFTDGTVAAQTGYSYRVVAVDAAGHRTPGQTLSVTTPSASTVFADDFESGDLARWSAASGLSVSGEPRHGGSWAAREASTGAATYAYGELPGNRQELWARVRVYVTGRSTSVNLIGFRTSTGASVVNAYLDGQGRVSARNNVAGVTSYGGSTVQPGAWHELVLHATVAGTASSLDVRLDGQPVPGLALTGQDLGTAPLSRLQLGETSLGRSYDVSLDDVLVSSSPL